MNQVEIVEFINKNPGFALATCADNLPYVRSMMVAFADKRGIIFCTGREKDVCKCRCYIIGRCPGDRRSDFLAG